MTRPLRAGPIGMPADSGGSAEAGVCSLTRRMLDGALLTGKGP
jgi:hypothetical protein